MMLKVLSVLLFALAAPHLFSAPEIPTRLDITAQPDGAQVYVDGTLRGTTPCTVFDLPPGSRHVHLAARGHVPVDDFVTLEESGFLQKSYILAEEKALLLVTTEPAGADVKRHGVSLGLTPLLITSLATDQTYTLDLSLTGYQSRRITLSPEGRTPLVRHEKLALDSGTVACRSEPAGATVVANGIEYGTTPLTISRLPKGLSTLVFRLDGYQTESRELRLAPGDQQLLAVNLKPSPARLTVVTAPENAQVFVDGNYQGRAPVTLPALAPGRHEVRVNLPGHAPAARTITLKNGGDTTETFKLENVLGRLEIVTSPPGVRLFLDGKSVGTTRHLGEKMRSQILTVEKCPAGDHALLARLDGYQDVSRRITVKSRETTRLHLRLTRLFQPNLEIETGRGIYRGILVEKDFLGNLILETSPGVQQTFRADEIRKLTPLSK